MSLEKSSFLQTHRLDSLRDFEEPFALVPPACSERKSSLCQFVTPTTIADFMSLLFLPRRGETIRLLDAGAGRGALLHAFLRRHGENSRIDLTAYEIDENLIDSLRQTLHLLRGQSSLRSRIITTDFVDDAVLNLRDGSGQRFTHAILNPPYHKIKNTSHYRKILRSVGIETVNLYSAFLSLSLALLEPLGQLVAIIPRSFCNGPYYRSFRKFISS
ncbi:MAG: methyltransferase [Magnetococcales bacterium]|nr:methyltransferase [Magnetococcales bacterium]